VPIAVWFASGALVKIWLLTSMLVSNWFREFL
jgi:hypothetical protein